MRGPASNGPALASTARRSTRSFIGSPLWPLTHSKLISCWRDRYRSTNGFHRSTLATGLRCELTQPVLQPLAVPLLAHAVDDVGRVADDGQLAGQRAHRLQRGVDLHPLVGAVRLAARCARAAVGRDRPGPAAGTGVPPAGAVGVRTDHVSDARTIAGPRKSVAIRFDAVRRPVDAVRSGAVVGRQALRVGPSGQIHDPGRGLVAAIAAIASYSTWWAAGSVWVTCCCCQNGLGIDSRSHTTREAPSPSDLGGQIVHRRLDVRPSPAGRSPAAPDPTCCAACDPSRPTRWSSSPRRPGAGGAPCRAGRRAGSAGSSCRRCGRPRRSPRCSHRARSRSRPARRATPGRGRGARRPRRSGRCRRPRRWSRRRRRCAPAAAGRARRSWGPRSTAAARAVVGECGARGRRLGPPDRRGRRRARARSWRRSAPSTATLVVDVGADRAVVDASRRSAGRAVAPTGAVSIAAACAAAVSTA